MDARLFAIRLSLLVSLLMLAGKWIAYVLTDSTAILSDAAESVVHIAATCFAAFSLWYSLRPPDPEHPYGHGKIAFFSAGFEGGLILIASVSISFTAVVELISGPTLNRLGLGLGIVATLGLVNLVLGSFLMVVGRREDSLVLIANGRHVLVDMWTSFGVVAGVLVVWLTDIVWLDPVIALAVAGQIAYGGVKLIKQSVDGLMDRVHADTSIEIVRVLQDAVSSGAVEAFHQLRHRQVGDAIWIDVHLLLSGDLSLDEVHTRISAVERQLHAALPQERIVVSTHPEPADHIAAHPEGHDEIDPLARGRPGERG